MEEKKGGKIEREDREKKEEKKRGEEQKKGEGREGKRTVRKKE